MTYAPQKTQGKFSRKALPTSIQYFTTQCITLSSEYKWNEVQCPFHHDTKLSLHINVERGAYSTPKVVIKSELDFAVKEYKSDETCNN